MLNGIESISSLQKTVTMLRYVIKNNYNETTCCSAMAINPYDEIN